MCIIRINTLRVFFDIFNNKHIQMTSWINNPGKQLNIGYRQNLPEGKFSLDKNGVTVVSAFYIMKSAHTLDEYKRWMKPFLENVPCHLIFYTEEQLVPFIRECRRAYEDITDVIVIPKHEWVANKRFPKTVWEDLLKLDTNTNASSDLYKFYYEKKEFIKRTIKSNPFGHTDYLWMNAGICKSPEILSMIKAKFPFSSRIPIDKVMLYNSTPFDYSDEKIRIYGSDVILGARNRSRICSNIIAASATRWLEFCDIYDSTIGKFIRAKLFWGMDQAILSCLVMENKINISLIEYKNIVPDAWKSQYALLYLGCPENVFKVLRDSSQNGKKKTENELTTLAEVYEAPKVESNEVCSEHVCKKCGC